MHTSDSSKVKSVILHKKKNISPFRSNPFEIFHRLIVRLTDLVNSCYES